MSLADMVMAEEGTICPVSSGHLITTADDHEDHDHEHHHDHEDRDHDHHHDHDEHHHDHDHDEHCSCDHDHDHEHHHDHDDHCGCGHDHHTIMQMKCSASWGKETPRKYTKGRSGDNPQGTCSGEQ